MEYRTVNSLALSLRLTQMTLFITPIFPSCYAQFCNHMNLFNIISSYIITQALVRRVQNSLNSERDRAQTEQSALLRPKAVEVTVR